VGGRRRAGAILPAVLILAAWLAAPGVAGAQGGPALGLPGIAQAADLAGERAPRGQVPQNLDRQPGPPPADRARVQAEELELIGETGIRARNVVVQHGEYVLTGERLTGDFDQELVFSGGATLTYRGQSITGDAIRFAPRSRSFRVENVRAALTPEFLQGRLLSPLYLSGESLSGRRRAPLFATAVDVTTCENPTPELLIRAGEVKVEPGRRVTLRRAALLLWGRRVFVLPTLIIPLDRQLRHSGYTPQVGRSVDEGWFVKSALNYLVADRVPGLLHLDLMEKKGLGLGVEQAWSLAKIAGYLALYGIPTGGTSKNLTGRLNNRLNLGGGQILSIDNDFQQNSYLSLPETTTFNTRVGFTRAVLGASTSLSLARQATDSGGFATRSYMASLSQNLQLGGASSVAVNADYSRFGTFGLGSSQRTEQLSTRLQADTREDNYTLQLTANKNIPVGPRNTGAFFGGIERFPELSLSSYRFTRGLLSRLPLSFSMALGSYAEATTTGTTQRTLEHERALMGVDLMGSRTRLSASTDLNVSAAFQQYLYTDGSAQYLLRNNTTLTQRLGRRSGISLNYSYQRPEGGTPFRFDQIGQFHALNADAGLLDDRRFQLTARVGYDFAQTSFAGFPARPWQTLSLNTLVRPVDWLRLRSLFSYDPNTSRLESVTSNLRIRGRNEFAFDVVTRYDPERKKLSNLNGYINWPVHRLWRVIALFQYNGFLNRFESRNLQIIHDLHCLEASITYIDNPFGFRSDRQVYFSLRLKALPRTERFGTGQFGQAIDTSLGEVF